jgi:hypothetical protein
VAYPQGSYAIGSPGPTPRPAVVTWAGILLYTVAGLLAVTTLTVFAESNAIVDGIRQSLVNDPRFNSSNLDSTISAARVFVAVFGLFFLVIAALYVILAIFDLKGRNGMRITTWVIASIGVLCFGLSVGGRSSSTLAQSQTNGQTVNVHVDIPAAISTISTVVNIIGVLCLITVIILLALPASNEFFRRNKGMIIVPTMDPGYPQYPGYPPVQPPYDPNAG